jgi:alkylhydroperoxidase family enzyme
VTATNLDRAFAAHPEVYAAWAELSRAIRERMDFRRYELATFAAARRLRSSYCCLAHGKLLMELDEPVRELALDFRTAGLDEVDVAVMDLAERVVDDATSIGEADLQRLRDLGLSDTDIMDVALAAAARCFLSKTIDALEVRPDAELSRAGPGAARGARRRQIHRRTLIRHGCPSSRDGSETSGSTPPP